MTIPATHPATVAGTGIGPFWPDSRRRRALSWKEATA
jgi:hypothetical protein